MLKLHMSLWKSRIARAVKKTVFGNVNCESDTFVCKCLKQKKGWFNSGGFFQKGVGFDNGV